MYVLSGYFKKLQKELDANTSKLSSKIVRSSTKAFLLKLSSREVAIANGKSKTLSKSEIFERSRDKEMKEKFKELTAKIYQDKETRLKRSEELQQKEVERYEQMMSQSEKIKQELIDQQITLKKEKLSQLRLKAVERKNEIELRKSFLHSLSPQKSYRYQEMQNKFHTNSQFAELERHKSEIARKKLYYSPINHEELQNHSKNYLKMVKESQIRRDLQFKAKKIDMEIQERLSGFKLQKQEISEEQVNFREKQKHYSQLVKEIYKPKTKKNVVQLPEIKTPRIELKRISSVNSRPIKKKILVQEPPPKTVVVEDYLRNKRGQRMQQGSFLARMETENLLRNTENAEKRTKKYELIAKNIEPTSLARAELELNINDALIKAVQAKIEKVAKL